MIAVVIISNETSKTSYRWNKSFAYKKLFLILRGFAYSIRDFRASDIEILFIFFLLNSFENS